MLTRRLLLPRLRPKKLRPRIRPKQLKVEKLLSLRSLSRLISLWYRPKKRRKLIMRRSSLKFCRVSLGKTRLLPKSLMLRNF
jgi:hypothetical protein